MYFVMKDGTRVYVSEDNDGKEFLQFNKNGDILRITFESKLEQYYFYFRVWLCKYFHVPYQM